MTHTFAKLTVTPDTYDDIASLLRIAGYDHAFVDGVLDMHGIGLVRGAEGPEHFKFPPSWFNGSAAFNLIPEHERAPIPGEFKVVCES